MAGLGCWLASYPQDLIKTRIQCDFGIGDQRRYRPDPVLKDGGFVECAREIYKKDGLLGFWRGFSVCGTRAVFANAVGFYAYEKAKDIFLYQEDLE